MALFTIFKINHTSGSTGNTSVNEDPETTPLTLSAPQVIQTLSPYTKSRCTNALTLILSYTFALGSLILGYIHIDDCPIEKRLPTVLVALGGMIMVSRLLNFVYDCQSVFGSDTQVIPPSGLMALNGLFYMAEIGMFIAICCWAFSIHPTTEPGGHDYCDYILHTTSFYGCIVVLVFYGLPMLFICCFLCRS